MVVYGRTSRWSVPDSRARTARRTFAITCSRADPVLGPVAEGSGSRSSTSTRAGPRATAARTSRSITGGSGVSARAAHPPQGARRATPPTSIQRRFSTRLEGAADAPCSRRGHGRRRHRVVRKRQRRPATNTAKLSPSATGKFTSNRWGHHVDGWAGRETPSRGKTPVMNRGGDPWTKRETKRSLSTRAHAGHRAPTEGCRGRGVYGQSLSTALNVILPLALS